MQDAVIDRVDLLDELEIDRPVDEVDVRLRELDQVPPQDVLFHRKVVAMDAPQCQQS